MAHILDDLRVMCTTNRLENLAHKAITPGEAVMSCGTTRGKIDDQVEMEES